MFRNITGKKGHLAKKSANISFSNLWAFKKQINYFHINSNTKIKADILQSRKYTRYSNWTIVIWVLIIYRA